MREIKFRGKRLDNCEWVYGYLLKMFGEISIMELHDENTVYSVDHGTVGQYTELKDKNGVEIFEGDIVITKYNEKYVVNFCEERAGFYPFATDDGCGCCSTDVASNDRVEIIGNIHDNPELVGESDV